MRWFHQKLVIAGCEGRGDAGDPYLTRWVIYRAPGGGGLYLHLFHRSDADVQHDHPWDWWTLVLWRGYWEEIPGGRRRGLPGQIQRRRAEWTHRVVLLDGKPALTLNWMSPKRREWGFHLPGGWEAWREYFRRLGC